MRDHDSKSAGSFNNHDHQRHQLQYNPSVGCIIMSYKTAVNVKNFQNINKI